MVTDVQRLSGTKNVYYIRTDARVAKTRDLDYITFTMAITRVSHIKTSMSHLKTGPSAATCDVISQIKTVPQKLNI